MAAAGREHAAGPSTEDKDIDLYSDLNQNDEVSLALKSMQKKKSVYETIKHNVYWNNRSKIKLRYISS